MYECEECGNNQGKYRPLFDMNLCFDCLQIKLEGVQP